MVSVMLYPFMFCVALLMDLFVCVFDRVCETIHNMFMFSILLLNVMDLVSVVG